jgi:hypothetical protein
MVTVKDIEEISAFVNWTNNPKEDDVLIVNYLTKEGDGELRVLLNDALSFLYGKDFDGSSVTYEVFPNSPMEANSPQLISVPVEEVDLNEWELVDLINKFKAD